MSRINRIRIMNLNYNGNTIRIDDETFDLNGESTLLSLRNGGGKTVLVQMVISLFVNKSYRDFPDRPFQSYFTTNRPTFLMTEWSLDHGQGYFLTGMMVRKCQNLEENNNEELEMINFTAFYKSPCECDLDHLPVVDESGENRILKGFGACKQEFEELKKNRKLDFSYYDMSNAHHRRMYFSKLREYQINNKEWETIIKKVNLKESGLSELFSNARDEKGLIEKWLMDAVENKLNQDNNRIKEFQTLAYKFIRQYRENESKIKRKNVIEQYFEDADIIRKQFGEYEEAERVLEEQKSRISAFIRDVNEMTSVLEQSLERESGAVAELEQQLREIEYERISYEIYQMEDERRELVQDRIASEMRINRSVRAKTEAQTELCRFQCAGLYEESLDFKKKISELQGKIDVLLMEQKDSEEERKMLGGILYHYYDRCAKSCSSELEEKKEFLQRTEQEKKENIENYEKELGEKEKFYGKIKELEAAIQSFDHRETEFNRRFSADFARNIIGEYEEGTLELAARRFQDEFTELNVKITRLSEQQLSLKAEEDKLGRSSEELNGAMIQCGHELGELKKSLDVMLEEKNRRSILMRYVDAPDSELDKKVLLLERFDRKVEELEKIRDDYSEKRKAADREYENLRQGKVVELPENIQGYFEEQGIEIIYGMAWLKKNGRGAAENQKLVENNPFLPYSIILEKKDIQKLKKIGAEIYTNFPIPVIVREELEEVLENSQSAFVELGRISFLVMFNKHLLDTAALEKLLQDKRQKIEEWKEKTEIKRSEIEEYRSYRNVIENQSFTLPLIEEKEKKFKEKEQEQERLQEEYRTCGQRKKEIAARQTETGKQIEAAKMARRDMEIRNREYEDFASAYEIYLENRQAKLRFEQKRKEAADRARQLKEEREKIGERILVLREEKSSLSRRLSGYQSDMTAFLFYQNEDGAVPGEDFDYVAAKARYFSITEGISASINDLNKDLRQEQERYDKKCKELEKKNKYNFRQEEYASLSFSEEQIERLEENIQKAGREENAAREENSVLEKNITRLETKIDETRKRLYEKAGQRELKDRKLILKTDFPARLKLTGYEKDKKEKEVRKLAARLEAFRSSQDVMAEYSDFTESVATEKWPLENVTREELNRYQGTLRRDLGQLGRNRAEQKENAEAVVREIAGKEVYQEDFFKKGFDNLLALINRVYDAKMQLETITASYESILEKLKVDLENIDRERKNIEELFLEYVKDIDDHMRRIDKNSSINVRGKTIKMLKIRVPEWEDHRELYQVKVRDYVETFIRWGIEAIENGRNVEELLGKVITTRKLYDEVAGIGNIDIRLYKIEAEREVPISWAEVSANSGGEGFLSAFVILSCLLSYMRRDESDLFAAGEEGKVLIMDNPFAQTNAEHLLKPLMDMAKKTNTQLICLSGLGGDSIYNRFDNIYVLNVVPSNIRQGMQYLKSNHIKGNETKKVLLSQFQVEQMSLFEMQEE